MSVHRELTDLTLSEISSLIQARAVSPVEVVDAFLDQIDSLESDIRAFVILLSERARQQAAYAEQQLMSGNARGALHGIPVVLKDLLHTTGIRTSAGSRILKDFVPTSSATVAQRLEEAGTILLGKVTTHEFAMGVHTPPTRNPWDIDRIPGGSSGGSAAAVAARMCPGAIGTDTAGSIRIPSALCGVTGLKPTYGRVSRAGVIPFSWSLDHVGPIARTARDVALLLEAIAGYDPGDPTSVNEPVPRYSARLDEPIDGLRIGIPREYFFDRVDHEAVHAVHEAIDLLATLGTERVEVSLPTASLAATVGDTISFPEVSAYHRRWLRDRPDDYSPGTRANLELGELILATDYVQARRLRTVIVTEFLEALESADVIVSATTPIAAMRVDDEFVVIAAGDHESPLDAYCRLTYPANVTGLPALTVPCGFRADGLPLGLQLMGRPFDEARLLQVGAAYQRATDWHDRRPLALRSRS